MNAHTKIRRALRFLKMTHPTCNSIPLLAEHKAAKILSYEIPQELPTVHVLRHLGWVDRSYVSLI